MGSATWRHPHQGSGGGSMNIGRPGARVLSLAAMPVVIAGTLAVAAGQASAVTCPTVDFTTHAVSPPPAPGVDWSGCMLSSANLTGANLASAKLVNTDLADATLGNANLNGANLSGANLVDANMAGATLGTANLNGTILSGANLADVSSGGIAGTPSSLPDNWLLVSGYLVGPHANLAGANPGWRRSEQRGHERSLLWRSHRNAYRPALELVSGAGLSHRTWRLAYGREIGWRGSDRC